MNLRDLKINEDDFDLFVALDPVEKIEFLYDAQHIGLESSIMKQVLKLSGRYSRTRPEIEIVESQDLQVGKYRLCITSMKGEVQLNSNSLKVLRKFVAKLWNDGYILTRIDKPKSEYDTYRFFRAYKVIGLGNPICPN